MILLIDTDNKLSDNITLKNVVILMARIIKDDDKFQKKHCVLNKYVKKKWNHFQLKKNSKNFLIFFSIKTNMPINYELLYGAAV